MVLDNRGAPATTAANFIGYTKSGATYVRFTCPDPEQTFTTSNAWWACGPTMNGNVLATTCTSGTLAAPGATEYCNVGFECGTGFLFRDLDDQHPLSEYGCLDGKTTSFYRNIPSTTTMASAGTSSSTCTALVAGSSNTGTSEAGDASPSKAWIAGAVIGPVVGLVLLCGLGIWIWRLKRQVRARDADIQGQIPQQQPHQYQLEEASSGPKELQDTRVVAPSEVSGQNTSTQHIPAELEAKY